MMAETSSPNPMKRPMWARSHRKPFVSLPNPYTQRNAKPIVPRSSALTIPASIIGFLATDKVSRVK